MSLVIYLAGLIALVGGAALLVRGAAKLAVSAGISPLVVGLTVVAWGTGAPETAVSIGAALKANSDIAVAYTNFLILAATHHSALRGFSDAMLEYVLPLTVVALVVSLLRSNAMRP